MTDHSVPSFATPSPGLGGSASRRSSGNWVAFIPTAQFLADSLALIGSGFLCYHGIVYYSYSTVEFYQFAILFIWLVAATLFYLSGSYRLAELLSVSELTMQIVIGVAVAFLVFISVAFALKVGEIYSRVWVGAFFVTSLVSVLGERAILSRIIAHLGRIGVIASNIVVYGSEAQARQFLGHVEKRPPPFGKIVGVFTETSVDTTATGEVGTSAAFDKLVEFVRQQPVDEIVVAMPWSEDKSIAATIRKLRELPVNVFLSSDIVGYKVPYWPPPGQFETLPIFQVAGKSLSGWDLILKKIEDMALGILFTILLSPLLAVVAVLIKMDSPGPVIFKQKRHGFNNAAFDIYKFRTMVHTQDVADKTIQATKNDARITRLGRILRRTSIDELPQLFNVLNGTMSIVGPRPHAIDHNEEYATKIRGYFGRHKVLPGITGLAQVRGFRGITDSLEKMEGRIRYDIEYVDKWSITLDIKILLLTLFAVVWGKNAH